jgi:hypothetical protein
MEDDMFRFAVYGLFLAFEPFAAGAASARPVVVELFTSEGCSSCPPADTFLTQLARSRRDILPLAFHVTYWNSLGWRDPFSLEAATTRQYGYGHQIGSDDVYTPQIVVDGRKGAVGSDRAAVTDLIEASKKDPIATLLTVTDAGDRLDIDVGAGHGPGRIVLVGFDHEHRTAVGRGENVGKTLIESNIVRSLRTIGAWTGDPLSMHEARPEGQDAAVLLEDGSGRIIGAARLAAAK